MDALKDRVTEYDANVDPEHFANGVVHPVTKETITKYKKLIDDLLLHDKPHLMTSCIFFIKILTSNFEKRLKIMAQQKYV